MKLMGWMRLSCILSLITLIMYFSAVPAFSSEKTDPRKERLFQRVNTYWTDRVQGMVGKNYDYYDPFFRVRVKRVMYEANLFNIKFLSYEIGTVEITENIAKVPLKVKYEIPETMFLGKKFSVPLKDDEWIEDWIWIDDDWFKVFKVQFNTAYIPLFPSFPR